MHKQNEHYVSNSYVRQSKKVHVTKNLGKIGSSLSRVCALHIKKNPVKDELRNNEQLKNSSAYITQTKRF